jgi:predicted transcriptional regulator
MALGPFEARVMEVLWNFRECTVHEVKRRLASKRAYTTVMTTMARLFGKGLLKRRKQGHQFIYAPRISAENWGRLAASEFMNDFVSVPNATHRLLISSLLEALDRLDPQLQAEMQAQILDKRARLSAAGMTWKRGRAPEPVGSRDTAALG